jgi:hypothetical protein
MQYPPVITVPSFPNDIPIEHLRLYGNKQIESVADDPYDHWGQSETANQDKGEHLELRCSLEKRLAEIV